MSGEPAQAAGRGEALGYVGRYITGDGFYAKADADTFQTPAREEGYQIILPVLPSASGVTGRGELLNAVPAL